ncbi:MAG TPA: serine acetyltransferase [Methylophilaceae bacterium]|nr:serine acetyltransferase [Methylophilaceae bacterium]
MTMHLPTPNPIASRLLLFFCRHHIPLLSKICRLLLNCDIYCDMRREVLMPHPYGITIHSKARIGQRVIIMQHVTIGARRRGINEAPVIEDDVFIGAGARILGNVRVGHNSIIGANAIITHDVPAGATVVGANRIISVKNDAEDQKPEGTP